MYIKQSTSYSVPIMLADTSGNPLTGKIFSDVTFYIQKGNAGSRNARTLVSGELTELGAGTYLVNLGSSDYNTVGAFRYWASVTGSVTCQSLTDYEVVAKLLADVDTDVTGLATNITTSQTELDGRIGTPTGASIAADVASLSTKVGTPVAGSVTNDIAAVETKLGSPAGASVSADIASVNTKLGAPAGASVSADIAALAAMLTLSAEDGDYFYMHGFTFDSSGNINGAIKEIYDSAAHADLHDGATGLVKSKTLSMTWSAGKIATFEQKRTT